MLNLAERIDELTVAIGNYPDPRDPNVGNCIEAANLLRKHGLDVVKAAVELRLPVVEAHARAIVGMRLQIKEVLPPEQRIVPLPVMAPMERRL
jgi:hypothetical protein